VASKEAAWLGGLVVHKRCPIDLHLSTWTPTELSCPYRHSLKKMSIVPGRTLSLLLPLDYP